MPCKPKSTLAMRNKMALAGEFRRREPPSSPPLPITSVYFIQMGDVGPIKVGRTEGDPIVRLATLQTGSPYELHLLGSLPVCLCFNESALHQRFAHHAMRGEWFAAGDDLLPFIRAFSMTWDEIVKDYGDDNKITPYIWFTSYFTEVIRFNDNDFALAGSSPDCTRFGREAEWVAAVKATA